MLIDTHCHLDHEEYNNLDEVVDQMEGNFIITSGVNTKTNMEVLINCNRYSNVFGTLGIHPTEIDSISDNDFLFIEKNMSNKKIVGIGEIGLDYYWNSNNKYYQKEVFIRQLLIAEKYNKPAVIHSRDASNDTYEILKELKLTVPIDIHCYSSSLEMAEQFIKIGCRLGIGGVLTFKNSERIKNVVKNIGLENLLLETDSPYLSPEPKRGTKNVPFNAYYVAQKIADIKGISVDEVLKITSKNAILQFDLPIKL